MTVDPVTKLRRAHVKEALKRKAAEDDAFTKVTGALKKKFGDDVLTDFTHVLTNVDCVSTGFPHLDDLLSGEAEDGKTVVGTGRGVPLGRVIEVMGKEGAAKTTVALHLVAAFQKAGMRCAFIDAEHAVDLAYARVIGADMEACLFHQPDSAEQALDVAIFLAEQGAVNLIVVDSVAALTPMVELEGDMEDQQVGLQARLVSKALRKITAAAATNRVCVVMVNQLRQTIGGFSRFGPPPEKSTGGNSLKYYASIRIDMRVIRTIRKGVRSTGAISRMRVLKNKIAPPFRDAFAEIRFGKGIVQVWPSEDAALLDKKKKKKEEETDDEEEGEEDDEG